MIPLGPNRARRRRARSQRDSSTSLAHLLLSSSSSSPSSSSSSRPLSSHIEAARQLFSFVAAPPARNANTQASERASSRQVNGSQSAKRSLSVSIIGASFSCCRHVHLFVRATIVCKERDAEQRQQVTGQASRATCISLQPV